MKTLLRVMFAQLAVTLLALPAAAQTLVAVDDEEGVPFAVTLVVDAPGVMTNDTYGGGPAADAGATVTLLTPPSDGVLDCESDPVTYDLCPDGSFTYTPGTSFTGFDSFTYEVALSGQTSQATVTLIACTGGPTAYVCWQESAYLARLGVLGGYQTFQEGFEDDAAWGVTRDPLTAPSVVSQGVRWESNHPDPPASNELTTGGGPARTGLWGVYDPEHGYATGTPTECDITNPPDYCLFKDGFTGTREPGETMLYGVGGYLIGAAQPNLRMILDGDGANPIGLGRLTVGGHQFFGVIDTGGFSSFRIEETDGKVGQERYVFGDDFVLATTTADATPPQVTLINSWFDTGDGELTEGETTGAAIYQLLVSFSESVRDLGATDANSVTNPANYLLVSDGGNGFETASCSGGVAGNDVQVSVDWVTWETGIVLTANLDLNGGFALDEGSYRLLVCGSTSIVDWAGNPLDGDGNGVGGDDFRRDFSVLFPVNSPPTANPQSVTTAEDTAKAITLTGIDPDFDPLTYSIVTGPSNGGLSGTPPLVTYTPALNYHGPDSFTFRVWDGTVFSDPATVSITVTAVNDPPVADDQSVTTAEDTAKAITLTASDVDSDPLTYSIVTPPAHGALSGAPPNVTYTPTADYHGPDSFTFRVWDGSVFGNTATVSITVTPVNDPPVADDQSVSTAEDTAKAITLTASDVDLDALTYSIVTGPTNGSLSGTPPNVSYTPTADYHGPDSFTFRAWDGTVFSNTATVSITVTSANDPPVADDQSVTTAEDTAVAITLTATDIDFDPLTYSIVAGPTNGSLSGAPPNVSYTPAADYHGPDSFTFRAWDGAVFSNTATVSITVTAANDAPVADDQSVTTAEDTAVAITLTATDIDFDPLTYSIVAGPSNGGLSGAPPNVTYTPAADYNGPDSFTFRAWDGTVFSNTATVSITVTPVNDPPIADPQSVNTAVDTPLAITLTGSDVDGDPLSFAIGTPPSHGGLTGAPPDVTYTPDGGYVGPDSFTFTTHDGSVPSAPATVTITVTDVPLSVLTIGDASVIEGDAGSTSINVSITLTPVSGSPVSVDYATGGGTATAGSDYTAAVGTADFPAGATTATVPLEVLGDLMDEPDESFEVTLSNPVGAVLGTPSVGTVTIFDDDPMVDLAGTDLVVLESAGQALVELTLSSASGFDVTVDYATADGTATAPEDYGAVAGTAFIMAGATSTTVPIPIVNDIDIEVDEDFTLQLSMPLNAVLLTPTVTITIRDDDSPVVFEDGFETGDLSAWSAVVP